MYRAYLYPSLRYLYLQTEINVVHGLMNSAGAQDIDIWKR